MEKSEAVKTQTTREMILALIERLGRERLNHPGGKGIMDRDLIPPDVLRALDALEALL